MNTNIQENFQICISVPLIVHPFIYDSLEQTLSVTRSLKHFFFDDDGNDDDNDNYHNDNNINNDKDRLCTTLTQKTFGRLFSSRDR